MAKTKVTWQNKYFEVHTCRSIDHGGMDDIDVDVFMVKDIEADDFIRKDGEYIWNDRAESCAIGFAEELTEDKEFEEIALGKS